MSQEKEVAVVKQQATKAVTAANDMVIATQEDMIKATDILGRIKQVAKMAKARKEAITKPMMEALSSARDLFKPIEANCAEAEGIIKGKMLAWQEKADREAKEARLKLAKKVESGYMKPETAVARMDDIQGAQSSTQGKTAAVATRSIKKVRFAHPGTLGIPEWTILIEAGYLVWDESKARVAALKGEVIPGVEVYHEKVIASSSTLDADSGLLGHKQK